MKITTNRKAYFEYHILEEYEAGIVLLGSEVKSIRQSNVTISDSFIYLKDGEVWVKNLKVARYKQTHIAEPHDESRDKKLLLTKKEIQKISKLLDQNGNTCVPLSIFCKRNKASFQARPTDPIRENKNNFELYDKLCFIRSTRRLTDDDVAKLLPSWKPRW